MLAATRHCVSNAGHSDLRCGQRCVTGISKPVNDILKNSSQVMTTLLLQAFMIKLGAPPGSYIYGSVSSSIRTYFFKGAAHLQSGIKELSMPQGSLICQEGTPVGPHCPCAPHYVLRIPQNAKVRNQEPAYARHAFCIGPVV